MDLALRGKTVVVTGASRGIGRAIAEFFAREGCRLAICARGEDDLEQARRQLAETTEVLALPLDVTDARAVDELVSRAAEHYGSIDGVVGNVGGNRRGPFQELSGEDWRAMLDLNFESQVRLARAALPHMDAGGALVFVASIYGREAGGQGLAIYNATKSALISMAKILSLDVAARGIRVNCVAPGSIRFPGGSWDRRCQEDPEGMARFVEENLPLGRFGRADEVADVVGFLLSERASLVTGACWTVDGGQSRSLI